PNHMAIGLIAEDGHVAAADQFCQAVQVFGGGNSARRVVGGVEKNGPGTRRIMEKSLHIVQIRPKMIFLAERAVHHSATAAFDVWSVRREMRRENQDGIVRVKEGFAEELLEDLGAGSDNHIVGCHVDAELAPIVGGNSLPKRMQAQ